MTPIRAIFFDIGDTLVFDDPPLESRLKAALRASKIAFDESRWPAAFHAAEAVSLRRYLKSGVWDDAGGLHESLATLLGELETSTNVFMGYAEKEDCPPARTPRKPADANSSVRAGGQSSTLAHEFIRGRPEIAALFAAQTFTRFVVPGALELLAELRRRGFVLGAISDWEDTLPDVLDALELAAHFDAVAVSSLVGAVKPNPKLFQNALCQTNIAPSETLHVGDWYELDVCGARGVGMNALLFDHQNRRPDADCPRVTSFRQLSDWLLALPAPAGEFYAKSAHL